MKTIRCAGKLLDFSTPAVMGILNVTPDSFHDGGRYVEEKSILDQAERMLLEGALFLDIGGASSRPWAQTVSEADELLRVLPVIRLLQRHFPDTFISIDTWRAEVARQAVLEGACLVNDISASALDPKMFETVAHLKVPYILMHMQGTPGNMQKDPQYGDITTEVLDFFIEKLNQLKAMGLTDVLIDPGFGFGKTVEHNYTLLRDLPVFSRILEQPLVIGISRKSMICKPLGVKPADALNGTTALHMVALQQGASVLRVHDVREAMEVIRLWEWTKGEKTD